MAQETEYRLAQDKRGAIWDLFLYVPTLAVMVLIASQLWFGGNKELTYLLIFMTTIVFFIAFNRIAKTRLMLLPSAPIAFSVSKKGVGVTLKNGGVVSLVKDLRFFADLAGKSIGLVGVDLGGAKHQFVFHRGQFGDDVNFDRSKAQLKMFK